MYYSTWMPRKSRRDAPGALHHIIARGIEMRRIFENGENRGVGKTWKYVIRAAWKTYQMKGRRN